MLKNFISQLISFYYPSSWHAQLKNIQEKSNIKAPKKNPIKPVKINIPTSLADIPFLQCEKSLSLDESQNISKYINLPNVKKRIIIPIKAKA